MKLKSTILAVALALSSASVLAENISFNVPLAGPAPGGNYSGSFSLTHAIAGAFEDTFTFVPSVDGVVKGSLITTGVNSATSIHFTSGTINSIPFTFQDLGFGEYGFTTAAYASAPLILSVFGIAAPSLAAGSSIVASYSGNLAATVSPVPEPSTYAMMLAGLGLFGFIASRRRKNTEAEPRDLGNMQAC